MSLSNSAIQTIATYYPNMRGEPRCQHALTIYLNAASMDNLNMQISQYSGRILHVTLYGGVVGLHNGDEGYMKDNEHVDVFLTITDVTSIGVYAFWQCSCLKSVDLSNTQVENIEYNAFTDCKRLEYVIFPPSLKGIEKLAFAGCSSLKIVDLSNTQVNNIEEYAFRSCYSIKYINIPNPTTTIQENTFDDDIMEKFFPLDEVMIRF